MGSGIVSKIKTLKNCPFCGCAEIRIAIGPIIPVILCDKCGATVSFYKAKTKSSIIVAWNKRNDFGEKQYE